MANLMDSLKEVNKLRQTARQLDRQLREEKLDFASRDGRVKLAVNGKLEILNLEIAGELLTEANKHNLERMILNTVNQAMEQMQAKVSRLVSSQMGINLPGM